MPETKNWQEVRTKVAASYAICSGGETVEQLSQSGVRQSMNKLLKWSRWLKKALCRWRKNTWWKRRWFKNKISHARPVLSIRLKSTSITWLGKMWHAGLSTSVLRPQIFFRLSRPMQWSVQSRSGVQEPRQLSLQELLTINSNRKETCNTRRQSSYSLCLSIIETRPWSLNSRIQRKYLITKTSYLPFKWSEITRLPKQTLMQEKRILERETSAMSCAKFT